MGKQRKGEKVGNGKVTPVQIAFVVDRYLSDNNYTQTLTAFRSESSNLISGTKFKEAPKTLLSLSDILNEYISLKEQKLSLNSERALLDLEKCRVEKLLQGMQAVIQDYQFVGTSSSSTQMEQRHEAYAMPNSSLANFTPVLPPIAFTNTPTPVTTNPSKNKRKNSAPVPCAPSTGKKSCTQIPTNKPTSGGTKIKSHESNSTSVPGSVQQFYGYARFQSAPCNDPQNGSSSSVAKSLFKQTPHTQNDSACPETPPQAFPAQSDNSDSPFEIPSLITSNAMSLMVTPTSNPVISSEKVTEAPSKQMDPSMDRSQHVASSPPMPNSKRPGRRDHIKSRLDFDDSAESTKPEIPSSDVSTPATETEIDDMFDNIPDFNVLDQDFTLSGFLSDITLDSYPTGVLTSSLHEPRNSSVITNAISSDNPASSFFGILSERDTNREDRFTLKPSNSIAKCVITDSPGKKKMCCFGDQENMLTRK